MRPCLFPIAALLLAAAPASAELVAVGENRIASEHEAIVPVAPDEVWIALTDPAGWWDGSHSYSGDAANLVLDPLAGGCLCEILPEGGGTVEHLRIVTALPGRLLRMSGAMGPLQSEALTGTLSIGLTPVESGTRIEWDYVVSGFARFDLAEIAPAVDAMHGGQFARLVAKLGG